MTIRRFFVDKSKINNSDVVIDDEEHNHIKNVLRLNIGNNIIIVCGDGYDYNCIIKEINKNNTVVEIKNRQHNVYDACSYVCVYQAITKKDSLYLITQKLTELGVKEMVLIETANTTAKDSFNKIYKLEQISKQSIKQCKRSTPIKISGTKKLKDIVQDFKDFDIVIFANETEIKQNLKDLITAKKHNKIAVIVGSEGGFTSNEIKLIESAGAKSITLGKRILKAETASIVISSLVLYELGELN